jgi:arginyl-tRNA--protein-N-Asp/Glu arginylyltransferase
MKFCRINLLKTNYQISSYARLLSTDYKSNNFDAIYKIYQDYCQYKNFSSVMPVFYSEVLNSELFGYYIDDRLTAWSMLTVYDSESVESVQFAWDYKHPNLRLGISSIEHECAYYKNLNFKYLYLGEVAEYKTKFDGYEELGPLASNLHLTTSS